MAGLVQSRRGCMCRVTSEAAAEASMNERFGGSASTLTDRVLGWC